MKIEKVSENQIKFSLSKDDLVERNIKISELAYGSEKTQVLFREMMEQAMEEYGFEAENTPLMIEAVPSTQESIVIIVTKVSNAEYIESKFNLLPQSKEEGKYKNKSLANDKTDNIDKKEIFIYSFNDIDIAIDLAKRISNIFEGVSALCKYNKLYYLIMENDNIMHSKVINEIDTISGEYGTKHISDSISKYHLLEHGEVIIPASALQILTGL